MPNPFVHVELNSTDPARSKEFYGKLFKWQMQDMQMPEIGTYTLINVGEGTGGGMMKQLMPGAPSAWMAYVSVDDVQADKKSSDARCSRLQRRDRSAGHGLVFDHHRPHRRDAGAVASQVGLLPVKRQ